MLTFEHELVDLAALAELEARGVRVRPSTAVLRLAVDKLHQRETLSEMDGVDVPAYARVSDSDAPGRWLRAFAAEHGWPLVLKARSGGYDGRGVWICADADAAAQALEDGRAAGLELYVEEAVEIATEVAVLVARSPGRRGGRLPARSRPFRSTGCVAG